jgi:hypothetical protein
MLAASVLVIAALSAASSHAEAKRTFVLTVTVELTSGHSTEGTEKVIDPDKTLYSVVCTDRDRSKCAPLRDGSNYFVEINGTTMWVAANRVVRDSATNAFMWGRTWKDWDQAKVRYKILDFRKVTPETDCDVNKTTTLARSLGEKDTDIADAFRNYSVCTYLYFLREHVDTMAQAQQPSAMALPVPTASSAEDELPAAPIKDADLLQVVTHQNGAATDYIYNYFEADDGAVFTVVCIGRFGRDPGCRLFHKGERAVLYVFHKDKRVKTGQFSSSKAIVGKVCGRESGCFFVRFTNIDGITTNKCPRGISGHLGAGCG